MKCPTCDEATEPLASYQPIYAPTDFGYTCVNRHRWETVPGGGVLLLPNVSTGFALTVFKASHTFPADGIATGTVIVADTRAQAAAGKLVKLRISTGGSAGVTTDCITLDASGQGTFIFGATTVFTGELTFEVYYENDEADPATFTVRRGS